MMREEVESALAVDLLGVALLAIALLGEGLLCVALLAGPGFGFLIGVPSSWA